MSQSLALADAPGMLACSTAGPDRVVEGGGILVSAPAGRSMDHCTPDGIVSSRLPAWLSQAR
ncbi:hypothetical protein PUNSTDRAFT_56000 [Punctularia strigosozonata HHB-11173 SS5]|uniref:Uncharacterized protein n=1 Tax=Punctularia strigosozonata (strain HHB-11173) TaxID=741275 RepID=R7S1V0_PUNST|nr:uncharacterized protein PUNSTDRAFT_56000 [Punctularia strigosozonata HHB-11173 SS5]EIN03737.1 hypothetical protein PUNSTDRAFT_56000 [Punctularia strigosozonata HHB-11173 SS5]